MLHSRVPKRSLKGWQQSVIVMLEKLQHVFKLTNCTPKPTLHATSLQCFESAGTEASHIYITFFTMQHQSQMHRLPGQFKHAQHVGWLGNPDTADGFMRKLRWAHLENKQNLLKLLHHTPHKLFLGQIMSLQLLNSTFTPHKTTPRFQRQMATSNM